MDPKVLQEHFGDVIDVLDEPSFGALAGEGASKHFRVSWHLSADGPYLRVRCSQCGTQNHVYPEWDELLICAHGRCPTNMQTHEAFRLIDGVFVMPVRCRSCNAHLSSARFTKDEAEKQIHQGMKAGAISPEWVRTRSQQIQAQLQGYQNLGR